jgi:hypothetical protein
MMGATKSSLPAPEGMMSRHDVGERTNACDIFKVLHANRKIKGARLQDIEADLLEVLGSRTTSRQSVPFQEVMRFCERMPLMPSIRRCGMLGLSLSAEIATATARVRSTT